MVNRLATLVKLSGEPGQLGWQRLVNRLAVRKNFTSALERIIEGPHFIQENIAIREVG